MCRFAFQVSGQQITVPPTVWCWPSHSLIIQIIKPIYYTTLLVSRITGYKMILPWQLASMTLTIMTLTLPKGCSFWLYTGHTPNQHSPLVLTNCTHSRWVQRRCGGTIGYTHFHRILQHHHHWPLYDMCHKDSSAQEHQEECLALFAAQIAD